MLKSEDRIPTFIAWDVKSYGYECAVLDQEGQILETYEAGDGAGKNETFRFARHTAREWAKELGIPLRKGRVFRDTELMLTLREIEEIP